jgi:hypothetical protein
MEKAIEENPLLSVIDTAESPAECCDRARRLWLDAQDEYTMNEVEALYRQVWFQNVKDANRIEIISKKPRLDLENSVRSTDDIWKRLAGEKLALILLQSSRTVEADRILRSLGFTCRLAESVLNYSTVVSTNLNHIAEDDDVPCQIYDNFVTDDEINMFRSVFLNPTNSYWVDHNYAVEPPSPYFSYLIPLQKNNQEKIDVGIMEFVHKLQRFLACRFPVRCATYCEMWAHNRPHATGHQFHFDSDNEGCTKTIRNPICSCIIYLTDKVGGPSVVTNQRLASQNLASAGWMCHPSLGRLVVFEGNILHGVVPGKGHISFSIESEGRSHLPLRRVSIMFAFWRKIRVRDDDLEVRVGAARSLPKSPLWAQQLRKPLIKSASFTDEATAVQPTRLDHVYESTSNGKPWIRGMGLPHYEEVFQGF